MKIANFVVLAFRDENDEAPIIKYFTTIDAADCAMIRFTGEDGYKAFILRPIWTAKVVPQPSVERIKLGGE